MTLAGGYLEVFLSRIVYSESCWSWRGAHREGYGEGWDGAHPISAHRAAHELWIGPIPAGYEVDHLCHTQECVETAQCSHRGCVNPEHLQAVPPRVNNLRSRSTAAINARKTHCPQGHLYDEINTHVTPRGTRSCRECWKISSKERWARVRESRPSRAQGEKTHCPQGQIGRAHV